MSNLIASAGQETNAVQTFFDVKKPQLSDVLFLKYGDQGRPFFNLIMHLGQVLPVAGETFGHYELGWIHRSFSVQNSVSSPGLNNSQTVIVNQADVQTGTNTVYPRVRDIVQYRNNVQGTIVAKVQNSPGVWQLTIEPQNAGILPAVGAGETIIIMSNMFQEGTNNPEGSTNLGTKYTFKTQIIKDTYSVTGSAMTNQFWYSIDTQGNNTNPYGYGQMEAEYRELLRISQAILWQQETTNNNIGGTSMTGLFPWLDANAPQLNVQPGTFTEAYFNQIDRVLNKRRVGGDYLWAAGPDQLIDVNIALQNLFAQNPVIFNQTPVGQKIGIYNGEDVQTKFGVNLGFRSITTPSSRNYTFTAIPQNSFEQLGGAPGFNLGYWAAVIPLDNGTDARSGEKMARMRYRYKDFGGVSRMMRVAQTGMMVANPTNDNDSATYNILHEGGAEWFGPETFFLIKP